MQTQLAQMLFRLAWADGVVKQSEVDLIADLLTQKGIGLAQRLALMDQGLSHPPGSVSLEAPMSEHERLQCMDALVKVCFADGHPQPAELTLLGDLALRWGISANQLEQLRRKS
ncbi:MAG: TerB family tellurite resistance protein [Candidatus Eremiobacteraeota bacterium]|nr:TerB family tellurite resistance protein [Candidatus Eremiobacteraeota bacterium]